MNNHRLERGRIQTGDVPTIHLQHSSPLRRTVVEAGDFETGPGGSAGSHYAGCGTCIGTAV